MTIRLTSPEAFDKVLEKLKQNPFYNEESNASFFRYCVDDIRKGIAKDDDEWYLDIEWSPNCSTYKVEMIIRYHKRSDIQTDEEFLTEKENDNEE